MAPLISGLGDGHTNLWFPESLIRSDIKGFFPLQVQIDPETFSITTENGNVEILSVNGEDAQAIVTNMLRYSSGELMPFRIQKVSLFFPVLMKILYPAEEYRIAMVTNGIRTDTLIMGSQTVNMEDVFGDTKIPYSYYFVKDKKAAVMEFNSFHDTDKMKVFLDSMFLDIKNNQIENLIIDIRANDGGNSVVGDELFQYISPVPFRQYGKTIVRISPLVKKIHSYYSDKPEGYETLEQKPPISLRPNPLRCAGQINIFLLTSSQSFSSTTDFAWAFQYFKMGTIVGQETGGSIVSFGDSLPLKLKAWGMTLTVSFKKFYTYGVDEDIVRGVLPDIAVPADEALDYTLNNLITE